MTYSLRLIQPLSARCDNDRLFLPYVIDVVLGNDAATRRLLEQYLLVRRVCKMIN